MTPKTVAGKIMHSKSGKIINENKHVKRFRLGEYGEGDAGVTIAELK